MKRKGVVFIFVLLVVTPLLSVSVSAQDSDWTLTETVEISGFFYYFRMAYPAGWFADVQRGTAVMSELETDLQLAHEGNFATESYTIRFEFPRRVDLQEQGLPGRDATLDDLLRVNSLLYSYTEPTEVSEISFFSWPALRVRTVDGMGNEVTVIQGFLATQPFLLSLAAPSAVDLEEFLPTWEQMLDSIEMVTGVVDVGEYGLGFECQGQGNPTVILETGWGGTYADWSSPQRRIADFTHVCAANRRSELGSGAVQRHTEDLHTLLVNAQIKGPYVLVGWSYGGLVIRVYAHEYPEDVVGMVFVDSSHENQEQRLQETLSPEEYDELRRLEPADDFETSLARVAETGSLGDMPVIVLTAERFDIPPQLPFLEQEFRPIWNDELQVDLAHLSSNGRQIIVEGTDHNNLVMNSATVDAIREVVEEVRTQMD